MYEPAPPHFQNLAFLWPAYAAAATSDMAAFIAKHFSNLAVGGDGPAAQEPAWTTTQAIALELPTVRLRDFTTDRHKAGFPALLCAPFALHGAMVSDLAPGHSLVAALRAVGLSRLFVTDWRSATAETRYRGINDYLADLNVLIDHIGAPVDLIGLCQGGLLALIYATRFPDKVRKLVLAGAPIDIAAAPSDLSRFAEASPTELFYELVRLGDGIIPGRKVLKFWAPSEVKADEIRQLLQSEAELGSADFARLEGQFRDWYAWTLDLPGTYFLETVEKIYKRNEVARGRFVALGQRIDLAKLRAPLFLFAARDDELVAPAQLFAAEHLVGTAPRDLVKATAPCRHLGLFMGRRILSDIWPGIGRWLVEPRQFNPRHAGAPAVALCHS